MRTLLTAAIGVLTASALLSAPARGGSDPSAVSFASWPASSISDEATDDAEPDTMLVVGDSITASYTRRGKGDKLGWWSILADRIGVEPVLLAEGGSGFLRRGVRCTGTSFLQRVDAHPEVVAAADIIILEGGVNDRRICLEKRRNGRGDTASTPAQVDLAVRSTLARVRELAAPDATIIVTVPWGNGKRIAASRFPITRVVRAAAADAGMEYVDTATEAIRHPYRTLDGIHPNRHGNQELAKRLYFRSSLRDR